MAGGASTAVGTKRVTMAGASHGKNHGGVGMDVRVIVRKRPVEDGLMDCITVSAPKLTLLEQKVKVDLTKFMEEHTFTYDDTFGELDDTRELYDRSVQDLVTNVFDGGTSTAFCFGQTASGKTFTLFGAGGGKVMSTSLLEAGAEGEALQRAGWVGRSERRFQRAMILVRRN